MQGNYTTEVGDYLVIWITGMLSYYIAEVTQKEPLQMKVLETGPFAYLKDGDYIIHPVKTVQLQQDTKDETCTFLQEQKEAGNKVVSGLKSLGMPQDNKLYEVLPGE